MSTLPNIKKERLNDFVSFLSSIDSFSEIGSQKDAHEAFLKILDIIFYQDMHFWKQKDHHKSNNIHREDNRQRHTEQET